MTDKITAPKGHIVFDIPSWTEPAGDGKYRVRLGQPVVLFKIPMAALADFAAQGTAAHETAEAVVDLRDLFAEAQRDPAAFNRAVKAAVEETVEKAVAEEAPDSEVPGLHDMRRVALEKANKRIIELQEEAELNRRTLVAVSRDLASTTDQNHKLKDYTESLEEQLADAQEQLAEAQARTEGLERKARENRAVISDLNEQIGSLNQRKDKQADTIRQQRDAVDRANAIIRDHAELLEAEKEKNSKQHAVLMEYETSILDLNKRLEYAEKQINDRGEQIDRQSYEIDNKYRELAERMRQVAVLTAARFDIGEKLQHAVAELGQPEEASFLQWTGLVSEIEFFAKLLRLPMPELAKTYPPRPDQLAAADRHGSVSAKPDPMDDLI